MKHWIKKFWNGKLFYFSPLERKSKSDESERARELDLWKLLQLFKHLEKDFGMVKMEKHAQSLILEKI